MPIANRSTNVRAKPTGLGQPNRGGACEDGSNAARPRADVGEQESLLAERRGLGNNLVERRVESTWLGKATGRDSVNATISMCTDFLVGTGLKRGANIRLRSNLHALYQKPRGIPSRIAFPPNNLEIADAE